MPALLEFRTGGFNPYAVKWSPYHDSRLAVASSANFGIVGNGRVYILALGPEGAIEATTIFDTNDGLFDLAWSEINENQLVTACGDGSVKLFDAAVGEFPVMNFHEHKREAFAVCWNPASKDTFLSSSWDGTVKIWSPARHHSLRTLPVGHCTYSAAFCPSNPAIVSAVSSDSCLRIYDVRTPASARYHLTAEIAVHDGAGPPPPGAPPEEVLTHDWNKYHHTVIATGGVGRTLRTFDIRAPAAGPLTLMPGHDYAIRRLAWSPHAPNLLLSGSYDMTARLWDASSSSSLTPNSPAPPPSGHQIPSAGLQLGVMNRHTEFVTGIDWCLFGTPGWVASVGWDERVLLWDAAAFTH